MFDKANEVASNPTKFLEEMTKVLQKTTPTETVKGTDATKKVKSTDATEKVKGKDE